MHVDVGECAQVCVCLRPSRPEPPDDPTLVHFGCDGWLLHVDSDDAARQSEAAKPLGKAQAEVEPPANWPARKKRLPP
jgi:hypothetical protein